MDSKNENLFEDNLRGKSTLIDSEKEFSASNDPAISMNKDNKVPLLDIFREQSSKVFINPINCRENHFGNYENYLSDTLTHISKLKNINFEYALVEPTMKKNIPSIFSRNIIQSEKKMLLLDLDETLIHADFNEEFLENEDIKYDATIKFYPDNQNCEGDLEEREVQVGIFIRKGVFEFLKEVSKYFNVGIFTASVKEYADAVISVLDPENKYIKFRLYRNNCINFNDSFTVKDLRVLDDIDLKKVVLVDNSIYSFSAQLTNGILINSFYHDKDDIELDNVLQYLKNYILNSEDVRVINEQFFHFDKIVNDISNNEDFE